MLSGFNRFINGKLTNNFFLLLKAFDLTYKQLKNKINIK